MVNQRKGLAKNDGKMKKFMLRVMYLWLFGSCYSSKTEKNININYIHRHTCMKYMINIHFKLIIAYLYELFVHIIESVGFETVKMQV